MDLAARPHITAGVALAAASIITVAPATQRLPDLHLAQHLRQVSVSDIRLTDAADTMIDLFAGVENELGSLADGGSAVPASLVSDVINPAQNVIVQTWIDTFENAGSNLQKIFNEWSAIPAALAQQVAANWVQYATDYVGYYQEAATAAVNYYTGSANTDFVPMMTAGWAELMQGKVTQAFGSYFNFALIQYPEVEVLAPLEKIPALLASMTNNLNIATTQLTGIDLAKIGLAATDVLLRGSDGFAYSLQEAVNAWAAGNPLAALTYLLNAPGAATNGFLNSVVGTQEPISGFLDSLLPQTLVTIPHSLAEDIVATDAQNILKGGSLATGIQNFLNQLMNGWPSLSGLGSYAGGQLTSLLQSIPSVLSNLPSMLGNFGGALASNIGLLISDLLKLL
ncbi:hypothetical protein [Mycobacterium malmoense]|uniref:hypothetical protein n=1 Tax=Mycobacterium malmoense TaxID=1780 RepID=UPI00111BEA50|nr:hypothetical protein [Mycobacterium malmoense]UNB93374.1 hypothetical protein H5T25_18160 [Mycobacterium malmoense]